MQMESVAGDRDHSLHQQLTWIDRVVEDYDVVAHRIAVGQQPPPGARRGEYLLVHQDEVANQHGGFHGAGGDLRRLQQERDHKR